MSFTFMANEEQNLEECRSRPRPLHVPCPALAPASHGRTLLGVCAQGGITPDEAAPLMRAISAQGRGGAGVGGRLGSASVCQGGHFFQ